MEDRAQGERNVGDKTPLFAIHDASVVRASKTILHVDDFTLHEGEHVALLAPTARASPRSYSSSPGRSFPSTETSRPCAFAAIRVRSSLTCAGRLAW